MYGSLRQLSNCHCNFGLQSRPRAFTPPRKKGGNNEKKNYQSDCCKHECCNQHELARPICGNLSGSITARSQPLRAKRSSPVGREDKPSCGSCQHSYTKLNNRSGHNSTRSKANGSQTKAKSNAINIIYRHSTRSNGVCIMLFCFKTTLGGNRGHGGYVWHPSGGGPCVKFSRPAVAVWIVSALCGAAPVDPF